MTYQARHLQQSIALINKDLSLENALPALPENQDDASAYQLLKNRLASAINFLLDNNLQQLLIALYRMDADEAKVKKILAECEPGRIGEALAELVIEREILKVKIREKYRNL